MMGFMGSLHCIGMCGGLVTALGMSRDRPWYAGLWAYQAGRVVTYTMLGLLAGMGGKLLIALMSAGWWQQGLTLLVGLMLISFGLSLAGWLPDPLTRLTTWFMRVLGFARVIQAASKKASAFGWFGVGLANGLLPCGLVYASLALALTLGDAMQAAWMMAAFGAGTVPAMMLVPLLMQRLSPVLRGRALKLAAALLISLGLMTMFRGADWMHQLMHAGHQHAGPMMPDHGSMDHSAHPM